MFVNAKPLQSLDDDALVNRLKAFRRLKKIPLVPRKLAFWSAVTCFAALGILGTAGLLASPIIPILAACAVSISVPATYLLRVWATDSVRRAETEIARRQQAQPAPAPFAVRSAATQASNLGYAFRRGSGRSFAVRALRLKSQPHSQAPHRAKP